MGEGAVPLNSLSLDKLTEHVLTLEEENNTEEYLGQLVLGLRLVPKNADHPFEGAGSLVTPGRGISSAASSSQVAAASSSKEAGDTGSIKGGKDGKRSPWSAVVNIVLVEGRGLKAMDLEGTSDPYCKVR